MENDIKIEPIGKDSECSRVVLERLVMWPQSGEWSIEDGVDLGMTLEEAMSAGAIITANNTPFKVTKRYFKIRFDSAEIIQSNDCDLPDEEWESCEIASDT